MDSDKTKWIYTQAHEAKQILETLKSGNNVIDISGHEIDTCKTKLMQLLHFRQYTQMYKFAFQEWDVETTIEQTYIEIGQEAVARTKGSVGEDVEESGDSTDIHLDKNRTEDCRGRGRLPRAAAIPGGDVEQG